MSVLVLEIFFAIHHFKRDVAYSLMDFRKVGIAVVMKVLEELRHSYHKIGKL